MHTQILTFHPLQHFYGDALNIDPQNRSNTCYQVNSTRLSSIQLKVVYGNVAMDVTGPGTWFKSSVPNRSETSMGSDFPTKKHHLFYESQRRSIKSLRFIYLSFMSWWVHIVHTFLWMLRKQGVIY